MVNPTKQTLSLSFPENKKKINKKKRSRVPPDSSHKWPTEASERKNTEQNHEFRLVPTFLRPHRENKNNK